MSPLYLQDGKLLIKDNALATNNNCCCGSEKCVCPWNYTSQVSDWYCPYYEGFAWYAVDGVPFDPDEYATQLNAAKSMLQTSYSAAVSVNQKLKENGWCAFVGSYDSQNNGPYINITTYWENPDVEYYHSAQGGWAPLQDCSAGPCSWAAPGNFSGFEEPTLPPDAPPGTVMVAKVMYALGYMSWKFCCGVEAGERLFAKYPEASSLNDIPIAEVRAEAIYGPGCPGYTQWPPATPCMQSSQLPATIAPWLCSGDGADAEYFYDWKCYPLDTELDENERCQNANCSKCKCITSEHPTLGDYVSNLSGVGPCNSPQCQNEFI